ncbi:hypothetical protein ACIQAC_12345 [Streptomyces sp. NPDC088387]|uniref:hypothetical protein n=1 Tax=Streptomyces sp. NPDC088387 TaxID=3365859 RepID=UPI00382BF649
MSRTKTGQGSQSDTRIGTLRLWARGRHRRPRPRGLLLAAVVLTLAAGTLSLAALIPGGGGSGFRTTDAGPYPGYPDRPVTHTRTDAATDASTNAAIPVPPDAADITPNAGHSATTPPGTPVPGPSTAVPPHGDPDGPSAATPPRRGTTPAPTPPRETAPPPSQPRPTTSAPVPTPTPSRTTPPPAPEDPPRLCVPIIGLCVGGLLGG